MTLSFRNRIFAVIVSLLLVSQLVTMAAVLFATQRSAQQQALQDLEVGTRIFDDILESRSAQVSETVGVLVNDFGFKSAVATADDETIQLALINQASRINADAMFFQDVDGHVVALHDDFSSKHSLTLLDLLESSGKQPDTVQTYMLLDGHPYQILAKPIFAPSHLGWVMAGFLVDSDLANNVKGQSAMDISFVSANLPTVVYGTSLSLSGGTESISQSKTGNQVFPATVEMDKQEFLTDALMLSESAGLQALLHVSLDVAMQAYHTLKWQMALIGVATLLLSLLLASQLSRGVTQPIGWLLKAARRIGRGDYQNPIKVERKDEIGELASTLNDMQKGIAQRESSILHAAHHDSLTDLPSRSVVSDRLATAIKRADRNKQQFAVLMLDLNRFKEINDTLGHAMGDEVIIRVARRLDNVARKSDTVARLGGDEFLMILENCNDENCRETTHRIHEEITRPCKIDDIVINVRVSMGLALYPKDGKDATTLLRRSDIAMYSAKEAQVDLSMYRSGQDEEHLHKLGLIADLCSSIEDDALTLFYQPKVRSCDDTVSSAEALVRWNHPEHGMIFPDQFITLAEESGNIGLLTDWVLRTALQQLHAWHRQGIEISMAVNLSALDLLDTQLPARVESYLKEFNIDPKWLDLEITESAVMKDATRANNTLNQLRDLGTTISIDDFGTGHSSLAQLRRLPVQVLKIDKGFVMAMTENSDDEVIVRSTIELAHNMGLTVVAEGVETESHRDMLTSYGCENLQGYLFSRPVIASEFETWLANRNLRKEDVA
ncbi:MAG: putative bifunctional diguanylate cyclase/phosphodiesterase [Gammaproteobacteria bacterium]